MEGVKADYEPGALFLTLFAAPSTCIWVEKKPIAKFERKKIRHQSL